MKEHEWCRTLGVSASASPEEIKTAYRRLVKQYHPDSSGSASGSFRFAAVTEAYKNLKAHESKRNMLDFPVKEKPSFYKAGNIKKAPVQSDIFTLGDLLLNGQHVGIRAFAARSLGNSQKRSAYMYLRKGLYDNETLVVKSSIEAIGTLGIKQCSGELGAVFSRGTTELKHTVLKTVEKIGPSDKFQNILLAGIRDSDPSIRSYSISLFSRIKT